MLLKILSIILLCSGFTYAQERLIIIGGGKRPADVLTKFVELSGKDQGEILIITWASGEQEASFQSIKKDISALSPIKVVHAPVSPLAVESKEVLLSQLKTAKGVFFTGGDQVRIMKVLEDESLFKAMHERYHKQIVFAGTSAGTAIMSEKMITGEGKLDVIDGSQVETKKGLGLLPNVIVDQHFVKRQRENRLMGLILQNPTLLGIGIDENTAVYVQDNKLAEVLGESQVLIFDTQQKKNEMKMYFLKKGDKFDLVKKSKLKI
ncbi:cyanophycinase [Arcicella aquatica]|uniref:Cyanophycinase n=1 Tax=Arcicella aquatica TaxID=217141 RepID=A0ABU5QLD9_9BACT|nr:cyanophycinase [Arcicella aquatica]MEA5257881.1 cyanophycinase [Arcicella aquatica]